MWISGRKKNFVFSVRHEQLNLMYSMCARLSLSFSWHTILTLHLGWLQPWNEKKNAILCGIVEKKRYEIIVSIKCYFPNRIIVVFFPPLGIVSILLFILIIFHLIY